MCRKIKFGHVIENTTDYLSCQQQSATPRSTQLHLRYLDQHDLKLKSNMTKNTISVMAGLLHLTCDDHADNGSHQQGHHEPEIFVSKHTTADLA